MKTKQPDAYREMAKRATPSQCPKCGVVFAAGRWTWQAVTGEAAQVRCPACIRIANRTPAGYVDLRGAFLAEHHDEIVNLIRNTEESEKGRHPLERIMRIAAKRDGTQVSTTGMHLARRIGDALCRAYSGELAVRYLEGDQIVQVVWQR